MRKLIKLLPFVLAFPVSAAHHTKVVDESQKTDVAHLKNFLSLSGGYYNSNYQRTPTVYQSGTLDGIASYNHSNSSGYGQIALGRNDHFGTLMFDHQIVIGVLANQVSFSNTTCQWFYRQNFDFGYDWMPVVNLFKKDKLSSYGILGAHYARFNYQKIPFTSSLSIPIINNYQDQIGFNLGAGINYRINDKFMLGLKYQHWQYGAVQNSATSSTDKIEVERIAPSLNLVGLELRYFIY